MGNKEHLMRSFGRMERERSELIARLMLVPIENLIVPPAPGAWSVAQVITHLAMAEESALAYLQKKLELGGYGPAKATAAWRLWALYVAISLPVRYKAPAIVAEVPTTSFDVALRRWEAVRSAMHDTYDSIDEHLVGQELFKHPMAGKFSLLQGVGFMRRHVQRHCGQVERTLRRVGS